MSCICPGAASSIRHASSTSRRGSGAKSRRRRGESSIAYYLALAVALLRLRVSRFAAAAAALIAIVIVAGPQAVARDAVALPGAATLRVVFLDVGQGDATLLMLPDRRAFLVDAGGLPATPLQDPTDGPAFDIGERVVAPSLRAFGVRALDTLVLTHADSDHIGGAAAVLSRFRPRAVWEGVPVPRNEPLQWVQDAATAIGAEWRRVQIGDELLVGQVSLRVLHPPLPEWERQRVRNDDSVVLEVRFGNVSIILPGDAGKEAEARLLDQVDSSRLDDSEGPAPRQRHIEHERVRREVAPRGRRRQRWPQQPLRPSREGRHRSLPSRGRGDLLDRGGWGSGAGYGWCRRRDEDVDGKAMTVRTLTRQR